MAQANKQLQRELLQSQKATLLTYRAPRRVVPLGLSPGYVKDWTPADAFRELHQNWKDAIIERFNVDRQSFVPFLEDHGDLLSIVVPEPHLADQPGERENRRAYRLHHDHAHTAHEHLVGRRGDGLKLAAPILSRDRYTVSIAASGCNWRFDVHTDTASVSCTVAPSQKTKSIEWTDPALDMASLRYHVERDVAVVIGATRAKSSRPVAPDAFLEWIRLATIDIRGLTYPSSLITTAHGDLIQDPQLRGQLCHNGITLTNFSLGGAFLFAYNFVSWATCRDRHRPKSWRAAARHVQQIWEEVLGKQKDTVLPLLVDLLWKHAHSAEAEIIGPRLELSASLIFSLV